MHTSQATHCNATVLLMAMELSNSKWKLAFSVGPGRKPRRREVTAGAIFALLDEIKQAKRRFQLDPQCQVMTCYEAGRDGFWIHRFLCDQGITNLVVDSSSIEISRRQRRAKTDRLDAEKLLSMLMRYAGGENSVWSVIHPPTPQQEDARQLHRELETLKREQTRHGNRIKGLLVSQGIRLQKIDRQLPQRLEKMRLYNCDPLPVHLKQRILREFERMQLVNRQIRDLEMQRAKKIRQADSDPMVCMVRHMMGLCGIGPASSWLFVYEVFGWRQIGNRRQLGSLLGLTPTPSNSGNVARDQGISKSGNRRMRSMAIEIAWGWLRYQPDSELAKWYQRRFGHGSKRLRRIGIVALTRKLMIALWKYLRDGEIPDGARIRQARYQFSYTPSLS